MIFEVLVGMATFIVLAKASCTFDQKKHCLNVYYRSTSFWQRTNELRSCRRKNYAEFSHLCQLDQLNYNPNNDHCCCSLSINYQREVERLEVMCCRYQQEWNLFRCSTPSDLIDVNSLESKESLLAKMPSSGFAFLCYIGLSIFFLVLLFTCLAYILFKLKKKKNKKKQTNLIYRQPTEQTQSNNFNNNIHKISSLNKNLPRRTNESYSTNNKPINFLQQVRPFCSNGLLPSAPSEEGQPLDPSKLSSSTCHSTSNQSFPFNPELEPPPTYEESEKTFERN